MGQAVVGEGLPETHSITVGWAIDKCHFATTCLSGTFGIDTDPYSQGKDPSEFCHATVKSYNKLFVHKSSASFKREAPLTSLLCIKYEKGKT